MSYSGLSTIVDEQRQAVMAACEQSIKTPGVVVPFKYPFVLQWDDPGNGFFKGDKVSGVILAGAGGECVPDTVTETICKNPEFLRDTPEAAAICKTVADYHQSQSWWDKQTKDTRMKVVGATVVGAGILAYLVMSRK